MPKQIQKQGPKQTPKQGSKKVRKMTLPLGWYPRRRGEVEAFIEYVCLNDKPARTDGTAKAVVAPHAGWFYSGRLLIRALDALDKSCDTIVVVGGHLAPGSPVLIAEEDAVKTPQGHLDIDVEFSKTLKAELNAYPDIYDDSSVEIILPAVHYFFPKSKIVWLRVPPDMTAYEAGLTIAATAEKLNRNVAVIGSTDLTHYGPSYGFMPMGFGTYETKAAGLKWVQEVNDKRFIDAVLSAEPTALRSHAEHILELAQTEYSACSAGAVICAMAFAQSKGRVCAKLLEYTTSAVAAVEAGDTYPPETFVGYAAFEL